MIDVYTLDTHFFSVTGKTVHVEMLLNKIFEKKGLPVPVKVEKNRYGKPFLKEYPRLHFNGSHSGDYLVCAMSQNPVGVDVQRIDRTKRMMSRGWKLWTMKNGHRHFTDCGRRRKAI